VTILGCISDSLKDALIKKEKLFIELLKCHIRLLQ